ncbi:MAG: hypothetical protein IJ496_04860 [Ruminococcus sp.]|nr:hypothetical protein [Ruminococcus sp.]
MIKEREPQFEEAFPSGETMQEAAPPQDLDPMEPYREFEEEDAYGENAPYASGPEQEDHYEQPENLEAPEGLLIPDTAPFQISYDMYQEAYKTYQKRFVYPRNRLFQLILLVLSADFAYHGAMDPDRPMYFMLLLVCISLMMILWYNPRKMRRNIMDVVREIEGEEHIFSMDENKITFRMVPSERLQDVPEEGLPDYAPTEIYYTKELRVIEKEKFFLICKGKQLFYVLPKYALYDDQTIIVRETFEENLGRRFRSKI